jgi:hypothetical protein
MSPRSWPVKDVKKELERSSDSILCAHEPFKMLSPVLIVIKGQEVRNNAKDEFPYFIASGGPNAVEYLPEHDRKSFMLASSVSPEQLEASGNCAYTGVYVHTHVLPLLPDHGLPVEMVVEPCTLDSFLEVVGYYGGTMSDYDWLDHPWVWSWFQSLFPAFLILLLPSVGRLLPRKRNCPLDTSG